MPFFSLHICTDFREKEEEGGEKGAVEAVVNRIRELINWDPESGSDSFGILFRTSPKTLFDLSWERELHFLFIVNVLNVCYFHIRFTHDVIKF